MTNLNRVVPEELKACPVCDAPLECKDWNDTGVDRFECGCMIHYRMDGTWVIADPYGFAEDECGCCKRHMEIIFELRRKLEAIKAALHGEQGEG